MDNRSVLLIKDKINAFYHDPRRSKAATKAGLEEILEETKALIDALVDADKSVRETKQFIKDQKL